jgi:spermidine/putrescine transport system ATP-binding protein
VTAVPAVRMVGVTRRFGEHVAVEGLDLDIATGELFTLLGPSGCGKSTTLRMLAGLDAPTAGSIEVGGVDMAGVPAHRRPTSMVFQSYALFPHLDVFENVAFGLRERRVARAEIRRRVEAMLRTVGLDGRARARPGQLSGGQQQRVALARSLVLDPKVLVLDEPLAALDRQLRGQLQSALKQIQQEVGITFVFVTHDQEEAFSLSDRVGVMCEGRLVQVGTPAEVYERPASRFVAEFVGRANVFDVTVVSSEGDRLVVHSEATGRVCAPGTGSLGAGDRAHLVIRPEHVVLCDVARALATGVVEDVSFSGPSVNVAATVQRLGRMAACSHGSQHASVRSGDIVGLTWEWGHAWIVGP